MKLSHLALSVCVSLAASPVFANEVLPANSPVITANTYLDIAAAGDNRLVAVGDRGYVLYTDDQGKSWRVGKTSTRALLTSVCFVNSNLGVAVGHDAVVLRTEDGGETWDLVYSDARKDDSELADDEYQDDADYADEDFDDAYYDDEDYYEDELPDAAGSPLLDVACLDHQHFFAVGGYGYTAESRDGGLTWERRTDSLLNSEGMHLNSVVRLPGSGNLVVAGESGLLFSGNRNARSWELLDSPYDGSFFGLEYLNQTLYAVGLQGNVWASRDNGGSWERIPSGVTRGLTSARTLADGSVLVAGGSGVLLRIVEDGNTETLYLPERENVSSFVVLEGNRLLIAGDAGLRIVRALP